jgi:hypothetical protein
VNKKGSLIRSSLENQTGERANYLFVLAGALVEGGVAGAVLISSFLPQPTKNEQITVKNNSFFIFNPYFRREAALSAGWMARGISRICR